MIRRPSFNLGTVKPKFKVFNVVSTVDAEYKFTVSSHAFKGDQQRLSIFKTIIDNTNNRGDIELLDTRMPLVSNVECIFALNGRIYIVGGTESKELVWCSNIEPDFSLSEWVVLSRHLTELLLVDLNLFLTRINR